jgi:hypothetical protein
VHHPLAQPADLATSWAAVIVLALVAASCTNLAASTSVPRAGAGGASGAGARAGSGGASASAGAGVGTVTGIGGFGAPDAGLSGDAGPTEDANCGLQNHVLARSPAIVILLQDRSTSMRGKLNGGATRWATVVEGIKPVLRQTEAGLSWGLKLFPDGQRCGVTAGVGIEPLLNNATAIAAALDKIQVVANAPDNLGLWDGTPVAPALRQTARYLASLPSGSRKYILLATDGQPTCEGGDPLLGGGDPDSDDLPSGPAAVAEVAAMGIKVPVIGIAAEEKTLNEMAKAGGMPRPADPAYYPANSPAELAAAFAEITGAVVSCTFDLDGMKPPSPDDVAVKIDGIKVPRDKAHGEGWDYDADVASVVLYGQTCERLKGAEATTNVQIIFGCPGIIVE